MYTDTKKLSRILNAEVCRSTWKGYAACMQSVINRPLLKRVDLLKAAVGPVPDEGIPVGRGTPKGHSASQILCIICTCRAAQVHLDRQIILCTVCMQSVINRPLLERLDLLKAAVGPVPDEGIPVGKGTVKGRLAKLVPKEFVLHHTTCSKI